MAQQPGHSLVSRREILKSSALSLGSCAPLTILGNQGQVLDQTSKTAHTGQMAAGHRVRAVETPRNTYEIIWEGGKLELNLIPMNLRAVEANEYKVSYSKGKIVDGMADAVGIVSLRLDNFSPIRRICWDSREHQLWTGFPGGFGGFHLRNVVVQAPKVDELTNGSVQVSCYFVANDVKTSVTWQFENVRTSDACRGRWDTKVTIQNYRSETLRDYLQLFACYHPAGTNYYWDESDQILPCSKEVFVAVRSSEESRSLMNSTWKSLFPYYNKAGTELVSATYSRPVLLSGKDESFGGMRHVLMVQPDSCSNMLSALGQARDYWIRPPNRHLGPGESFTTHVRHLIARVESLADLRSFWSEFKANIS